MKLFIYSFLVAVALGDRLENTYIPPTSAKTAGGTGSFLSTPNFGGSPSAFRSFGNDLEQPNSYIPPAAGPVSTNSYESSSDYSASQRSYSPAPQIRILKLDSENPGDGSYKFEYETENQISQHETGEVRQGYGDEASSVVRGSYSYSAPDGQQITVNYVADENGFRPEGEHIPTPPPVPEEIKKSLELIAARGTNENNGYHYQGSSPNSGSYEGVEIRSEATNRQYLAPAVARQNNEVTNRQNLAPAVARQQNNDYEATNRQYLAPAVARQNNDATNNQYLAPQNNQATNRQYLAPATARQQNNEAINRQYLAPTSGQRNTEAITRQYLAPTGGASQRNTEAISRQYLSPRAGQNNNEAANRQYLAPAVSRAGQGNNDATNRQYLAPAIARAGQDNSGYRY